MGNYATEMKPYEELEFSDDFMFGKTMEDLELCHDVIECLLQRPIAALEETQGQKEFRFTSDGKRIRLDLFNRDVEGVLYDAEMQNLGKQSIRSLHLPKRSRFYQSSIDVDYLNKNEHYKLLPESHVMFICTFDPFGMGIARYTFRERCEELPELALEDGTEKHFFNCKYDGDDLPEDLQRFYEYVRSGRAGSSLTERISEAVEKARTNEVWRTAYMKERAIIMDAIEEELENTKRERKRAEAAEERADIEKSRADAAEERADAAEERATAAEARIRELEAELAAATS